MSLILLANRAPLRPTPDGGWAPALGGLATALLPVLDAHGGAWIAMAEPEDDAPLVQDVPGEASGFTIHRVPLSEAEAEAYYQGMANRVLWPVAHYLVHHVEPERSFRDAYRAVNARFVAAALEASAGDASARFWVHDYHLMLVPEGLRAARPDARIGFFWHVPWPAAEVFRIVPSARALLRGILGADRIGFHTEGYAENFREAARDLIGARLDGTAIEWRGRRIETAVHPIGVDVDAFEAMADDPQTIREAHALRADLGGMHHVGGPLGGVQLIVGIDRLDYTKGLLLRLEAFERFLEVYPELHERVILYQVATPSRTGVPAYDRLKRDVDEAVGRINGRFSRGAWVPVLYRYRSFAPDELAVLYRAADVGLVTPLRDGMNLVAHEFVAVSGGSGGTDQPGALVLSELTGAADYLADGALLVNPYDTDALAKTLHDALGLSPAERQRRLRPLKDAVRRLNVHDWAAGFLDALGTAPDGAPDPVTDDAHAAAEPVGTDA